MIVSEGSATTMLSYLSYLDREESSAFLLTSAQSVTSMLLTSVVSVESTFSRTFLFASSSELEGNLFSPLVFRLFISSGARLSEGLRFTGRMAC